MGPGPDRPAHILIHLRPLAPRSSVPERHDDHDVCAGVRSAEWRSSARAYERGARTRAAPREPGPAWTGTRPRRPGCPSTCRARCRARGPRARASRPGSSSRRPRGRRGRLACCRRSARRARRRGGRPPGRGRWRDPGVAVAAGLADRPRPRPGASDGRVPALVVASHRGRNTAGELARDVGGEVCHAGPRGRVDRVHGGSPRRCLRWAVRAGLFRDRRRCCPVPRPVPT